MLIDSHSHLHFPVYKDDLENVFTRMKEKNVATLTVGTSYRNSLEAIEFSKRYGIPCSVGFHPSHARPPLDPLLRKEGTEAYLDPTEEVYDEEFDLEKLRSLIQQNVISDSDQESRNKNQKQKDPSSRGGIATWRSHTNAQHEIASRLRQDYGGQAQSLAMTGGVGLRESTSHPRKSARVLAVGECGLDYFRLPDDETLKKKFKEKQREMFEAQIELAREFDLPLIIHTRASKNDATDAYRDTLQIIQNSKFKTQNIGVMHCYLGDVEYAKKFLDLGFCLSFSGIVTFKKADQVRESAVYCPSDRILTETDCPYLAPEPHRGKQNEPVYVEFVLKKLEELRNEELESRIERNFQNLFLAKAVFSNSRISMNE